MYQWDIISNGGPAQCIANLAKGQDRGNAVTIQVSLYRVKITGLHLTPQSESLNSF